MSGVKKRDKNASTKITRLITKKSVYCPVFLPNGNLSRVGDERVLFREPDKITFSFRVGQFAVPNPEIVIAQLSIGIAFCKSPIRPIANGLANLDHDEIGILVELVSFNKKAEMLWILQENLGGE